MYCVVMVLTVMAALSGLDTDVIRRRYRMVIIAEYCGR